MIYILLVMVVIQVIHGFQLDEIRAHINGQTRLLDKRLKK